MMMMTATAVIVALRQLLLLLLLMLLQPVEAPRRRGRRRQTAKTPAGVACVRIPVATFVVGRGGEVGSTQRQRATAADEARSTGSLQDAQSTRHRQITASRTSFPRPVGASGGSSAPQISDQHPGVALDKTFCD